MRSVGIIDYGLCNIDSIRRATEICGGRATLTRDPNELSDFDMLILPGVGSFGAAMANLDAWELTPAIRERVGAGTPLLGICLGMQLLAGRSEEGGSFRGLDLIPGDVVQLKSKSGERIPHMGWNTVTFEEQDPIFRDINSGTDFYFVHSFHLRCVNDANVVGHTPYCGGFASVVRHHAVLGTQFHPEKSWPAGHRLLTNFLTSS
jgi:glutamine amidotransferase